MIPQLFLSPQAISNLQYLITSLGYFCIELEQDVCVKYYNTVDEVCTYFVCHR